MTSLIDFIFSVSNNAILIVGPDDRISFANQKAASRFKSGHLDQLIGQPVTRLFRPDDLEFLAPNLLQLAKNATAYDDEAMRPRFDDSRVIDLISTSQVQDSAGQGAMLSIHNFSGFRGIQQPSPALGQEGC